MLGIARDFEHARQHQRAAEWARKTVTAAEPGSTTAAEAQYVLGVALVESGEPAKAEQPLVSALKHTDGAAWQWNARVKLGYVWLQRGEDDSGIGLLQSVHASEEAAQEVRERAEELLRWWGVEVQ
jgi:predicted negative regulator of RcsB-dependent stress response